jgi:hypothetical protein
MQHGRLFETKVILDHNNNLIMKVAATLLLAGLGAATAITLTPENYEDAVAGKLLIVYGSDGKEGFE